MNDRGREIYEKALSVIHQREDEAEAERQEWLEHHRREAQFQKVMQKSAPKPKLVYKRKDDALVPEPEPADDPVVFTDIQREAIGQALAEIRRQCREEVDYQIGRLRREVGQLGAEFEACRGPTRTGRGRMSSSEARRLVRRLAVAMAYMMRCDH